MGSFRIVRDDYRPAAETIVIVRAVQTAIVCPSQWDAWDSEGRYYYLRHRNGRGSADRYASPDFTSWGDDELGGIAAFLGELDGQDDDDDPRDELESFCELAGLQLAPDADVVGFEEYVASREFV